MPGSRDAADTVQWAISLGCQVTRNPRNQNWRVHYRGRYVGTIGSTPSDRRAMLNAKSLIRRNIAKIEQGHA